MALISNPPLASRLIRYLARVSWVKNGYSFARRKTVATSAILLGRENGLNPNGYAQAMGNLLWTSTPIEDSPHLRFLQEFAKSGEELFESGRVRETDYFRFAVRNIEMFGSYYDARSEDDLMGWMRNFTARLTKQTRTGGGGAGSGTVTPVRRIEGTRCYQLAGDPHEAALSCAAGRRVFRVNVARNQARTALQELLDRVLWFDGNRELYQPIDAPEIRESWFLTRRCSDRLAKMQTFLGEMALDGKGGKASYLDIGSFYGWFVQKMVEFGLDGDGVERDGIAAAVGFGCYGLAPARIHVGEVVKWLEESRSEFDAVSCLSVLHHFVMGRQKITAEAFIKRVAEKARRVLFLDTGEEHESWFGGGLAGWNPDFVEKWVMSHTDFKRAVRLGVDEDARFPHERNYGRMLFAFVR